MTDLGENFYQTNQNTVKLLKTLLKTLNIISDVVEDPRFNDPEFDPLRDLLQKRKEAPEVKPEPDKRALAVRKIMEAFEHGEWEDFDQHLTTNGRIYWTNHFLRFAPLDLMFDPAYSCPSAALKIGDQKIDFLTNKEQIKIDELWATRKAARKAAQKAAIDAKAVNSLLEKL